MSALLESLLTPEQHAAADEGDRRARQALALLHYGAQAALTKRPTNPANLADWLEQIPAADLLREAQALARELATLKGCGFKPRAGCHIQALPLHNGEALVEFEIVGDSRDDEPPAIDILNVFVNGQWEPAEVIAEATLNAWIEQLGGGEWLAEVTARVRGE